jgi:hypothetical protein
VDAGDDEWEERLDRGVGARHERIPAGPEHGGRTEVLADPAGHEEVLVAVRVQQRGVMLRDANGKGHPEEHRQEADRDEATGHAHVRRSRVHSARNPTVSAER